MTLGPQFDAYKAPNGAEYTFDQDYSFRVRAQRNGRVVGAIGWNTPIGVPNDNEISHVFVSKQHRGKGVASAMLERAKIVNPNIKHSHALTDDGRAWSERRPL